MHFGPHTSTSGLPCGDGQPDKLSEETDSRALRHNGRMHSEPHGHQPHVRMAIRWRGQASST